MKKNNIKKFINKTIKEYLNENTLDKLKSKNYINNLLNEIGYDNYEIIGSGQHGVVLKVEGNCLKLTTSNHEKNIIKKIGREKFKTLPMIYKSGEIDNVFYYFRDCYEPIGDDLGDTIDQNLDDIYVFFGEKNNWNPKKSNTNLEYEFDDNFLIFLSNLKKDLQKLGLLPFKWDINGFSLNTYKNGNSYILVDF